MCNQIPIYPPNILKTLAKTASFAILSFVLPSRWGTTALRQGTAAVQVRHCRSSVAALSRLNWPLGAGGIYTFSYLPQWSPIFQLDHSLPRCDQSNSLFFPHSPLESLKLLPLILSKSKRVWAFKLYYRALDSRSSQWIVFITLGACS
jgi:hypothetical protein